ncbi:MAG TPA: hypothetical protein VN031_00510 [Candidatus Microsaccharimonas sp.]|nr:hypothetical protein [Candidatus Microsaccharimonas sp.]
METLAVQPGQLVEFDRQQRMRNDAETWLAEVLDGSMRTPFEYTTDGHELYAEDGGALGPIFNDAISEARQLQHKDPRLAFELRRRDTELGEYQDMLAITRGELPNTMVVVSDFPAELMHASEDVGGYNVTRKQTMLRVITHHAGRLRMYSQTLDGSDRAALEAIYAEFGVQPESGELLGQRLYIDTMPEVQTNLADRLTSVYDRSLQARHGGEWYAGRPEPKRDTYSFVCQQRQLIDHFVSRQLHGTISDEYRYNIAALLSKRFEEAKYVGEYNIHDQASVERFMGGVVTRSFEWELHHAGQEARAAGRTFSGCGATARAEMAAEQELAEAGYGNKSPATSDEDEFGPLTFFCTRNHRNTRPRGKLITQCRVKSCKDSVGC